MRKAVFIDNPSLDYMAKALGLSGKFGINYSELFDVLANEVGSRKALHIVLITVRPGAKESFIKFLKGRRYDVVQVESKDGRDDKELIKRIESLRVPEVVDEITVVTSDADFVPPLSAKARQGAYINIVATERPDADGRQAMGSGLKERIERKEFRFFELEQWKARLKFERKDWVERRPHLAAENAQSVHAPQFGITAELPPDEQKTNGANGHAVPEPADTNGEKTCRFVIDVGHHAAQLALAGELLRLQHKYPGEIKAIIQQ